MPSAKLTDLVSLAGAQVPTDLAYVVDVSAGVAGSKSSTLDDLFAIITKNITDGAVRFQGFAAPAASAIGQGAIYFDSTSNTFKISENSGSYLDVGDIRGPSPPVVDNSIIRFDGVLAHTIQQSLITIDDTGALGLPDGVRQTFNPNGTTPGLNVGSQAGDPSTPANGDLWYDSTGNLLRARINGATVSLGAASAPGGLNTQVQFNNAGAFGGVLGFTSDGTNVTAGDGNLRATSPLITTGIDDSNGNTVIGLTATGAAVNFISVANAAAGGHPVISSAGAGADINLTFSPKGAGVNVFTKNLLMDVGAGALDNLINVDSLTSGAVDASFGFFVAGVGSATANDGPYFLARGNTYNANSDQRGSFLFTAGNPIGPSGNQGTIRFFTGNEVERMQIMRDGTIQFIGPESYFGNGVTNAAPSDYIINATGGSGTDIAGADLILAGGKGTGNAIQGMILQRYPLTGATGTTLQSLSTATFPLWVSMHIRNDGDITVANTVTETSVLGASQAGSSKILEAGLARVGRIFWVRLFGVITTTGTPTLRVRLKLGSTTIADTTAIAMANNTASGNGGFRIEAMVSIQSVGATGSVQTSPLSVQYSVSNGGALNQFVTATPTTVDLTAAQTFDVTVEWGTANPSNSLSIFNSFIDMSR